MSDLSGIVVTGLDGRRYRLVSEDEFATLKSQSQAPIEIPTVPGPWIKRLRLRSGISLRQLAKDAGISPATLCKLEKGQKPFHQATVLTLIRALQTAGVTIE